MILAINSRDGYSQGEGGNSFAELALRMQPRTEIQVKTGVEDHEIRHQCEVEVAFAPPQRHAAAGWMGKSSRCFALQRTDSQRLAFTQIRSRHGVLAKKRPCRSTLTPRWYKSTPKWIQQLESALRRPRVMTQPPIRGTDHAVATKGILLDLERTANNLDAQNSLGRKMTLTRRFHEEATVTVHDHVETIEKMRAHAKVGTITRVNVETTARHD